MRAISVFAALLTLPGCAASVVTDIVTAPVKIASKTVDVLTTSQSEADERRGRALRKKEERVGKLVRKLERARENCEDGDRKACGQASQLEVELETEQDRPV